MSEIWTSSRLWRWQHWGVGDFEQLRSAKAVEPAREAAAIGTELAQFDPIAFAHIGGQPKRPVHPVGAVAGRAEQDEIGGLSIAAIDFAERDAPRRKAKAQCPGVAQIAVDA